MKLCKDCINKGKNSEKESMLLTNNQRKIHGLSLWRKKDKRKRYFTRYKSDETVEAFLEYCNRKYQFS